MTEWPTTSLESVAEILMGQSPPGHTYNTNGEGLPFLQGSAEFGEHYPRPVKWCSAPAKVAEEGDLMVSVRAPVGDSNFADQRTAIGRGLCIIRAAEMCTNEFLRLVIQHSTRKLLARSGSGMFSSITAKQLRAFEVPLPPLVEQHRIVDVIAAVDAQIAAVSAERDRARQLLDASITHGLATLTETATIGSLATVRSGPSWGASDETKTHVNGAKRVVKITNTRPGGAVDMSDETYVRGLPETTPVLDGASIVLIRTNGNRQRIGNAYLPTAESLGCAVSAFQFIVRANNPPDRDLIFWALRAPMMQARMSEAASGSTGLGNLAARWLKSAEIPWSSSIEVREETVERLRALSDVVGSLDPELTCLRKVRADLLSGVLTGDLRIPDSYDDLLEVA